MGWWPKALAASPSASYPGLVLHQHGASDVRCAGLQPSHPRHHLQTNLRLDAALHLRFLSRGRRAADRAEGGTCSTRDLGSWTAAQPVQLQTSHVVSGSAAMFVAAGRVMAAAAALPSAAATQPWTTASSTGPSRAHRAPGGRRATLRAPHVALLLLLARRAAGRSRTRSRRCCPAGGAHAPLPQRRPRCRSCRL